MQANHFICLNSSLGEYLANKKRILGECLLISSIPCKGFRTLVESRGLPSDSTCVLEVEPGKLDVKRRELSILFINLPICLLFKLAIIT